MRYKEILEACWTGYRRQGMKKKGSRMVPNCVPVSEEQNDNSDQVRRIQQLLNQEHNANLDVDGVLGDFTQKSINRYLPAARAGSAPDPDRSTAVQGLAAKHQKHKVNK